MEKIDHDRTRTSIRAALLVVALHCFQLAYAQTGPTGVYYDRFTTSGGTTMMTGPGPTVTARQAAGQLVWDKAVTADGGQPKVAGGGSMIGPSGRAVSVAGTGRIPNVEIGKAFGRFAGKVAPGVGWAIAAVQLAQELGFTTEVSPEGAPVLKKPGTEQPSGYRHGFLPFRSTRLLACTTDWIPYAMAANPTYTVDSSGLTGNSCGGFMRNPANNQVYAIQSDTATYTAPVPVEPVVITMQEVQDAIAAKSGWPTSSAVKEFMRVDIENGGKPAVTNLVVTGPATSPGPVKSTTNSTNNTTKTDTTTHNHNYSGNTVTTTTTVTSVTINNTSNEVINNETTTDEPEPPQEEKPKCPEGDQTLGCADADTPELETPKETREVTYSEENVFGSGSCPANLTASIGTLGQTVTVWDWQKTCNLALPLRALVLALATFAALLIVMPGRTTT